MGELLISIATDGSAPAPAATPPARAAEAAPEVAPVAAAAPVAAPPAPASGRRALATPATRKRARELGVDIQSVSGTGPAGRVTLTDVERAASGATPVAPAAPVAAPVTPAVSRTPIPKAPARAAAAPSPAPSTADSEVFPIRGLRKKIYEKMALSKRTASHFTYVEEVDMTRLVETRKRLRPRAEKAGAKLTFLPFIMKAVTLGLMDFPEINAVIDDERMEMTRFNSYNLSIAVSTDNGLTVPVIHGVEKRSIFELAETLADVGDRARQGKLQRSEFQGGTFTITSLGAMGGMFATPILNYPEVGILGIHKIEDRPVVIDGEIVVRKRMYLSSSFDHRVIDGHVGAGFVQRVKDLLEDPDALLLELR